ncbi:PfkB family carbohydrate kinase [Capnocytophaga cynodegmi]|uniref:PfkB family carbohydrate kinase n=1 Tax=Capnocytophaga cynodegmi TaxID=28189 RepID=UPI00385A9C86
MEHIVVGLGEILWDIFPEQKVMGGAPANFAYHASQFGLNGHIVSAIGNDDLGKTLVENLNEKN